MYTAINNNGEKQTATEAIITMSESYSCPECGSPVSLRNGLVKVEHFSHKPGYSCSYSGESMLHIQMKKQIFDNFKDLLTGKVHSIDVEKNIKGCRPDVFIQGKKRHIAIEVQTSILTPYQILTRTEAYHRNGIFILWVIPYEKRRIMKYSVQEDRYVLNDIKLKEYERIMMYLYFKTLVFWDVNREHGKGFYLVKLDDTFTPGADFYDKNWGEHRSFAPRKLKTLKRIVKVRKSVQITDFYPRVLDAFAMPRAEYDLPERSVLLYNWKNKS